jgi:hypothetical protein
VRSARASEFKKLPLALSQTYTLGRSTRVFRVVTGEKNPFWVTLFFWTRGDGATPCRPVIIHQGGSETEFTAFFTSGLPADWGVHATPSGYMDKEAFKIVADMFVRDSGACVGNPQFWFIDGHESHWDAVTLQWLQGRHVYCLFLKSNDSITDQANDNGPNCSFRSKYSTRYGDWLFAYPGVKYNPAFFNVVVVQAWSDFVDDPHTKPMIVSAFKKCRIHPLVDPLDDITELTPEDKRNAKMASVFATDPRDQETLLSIFSSEDIAAATVSTRYAFFSSLHHHNLKYDYFYSGRNGEGK